MNNVVNYLMEANLGLILFLLLYGIILNHETNFNFKRGYLLCSILVSVLFPLIKLGSQQNDIPSISHVLPSYMLPEIVITGRSVEPTYSSSTDAWSVVQWIYLAGVSLLSIRFFIQLTRLIFHLRKSTAYCWENKYKIVEMSERSSTFSFFNTIFIGQANELTPMDKELIIKHETVHVDKFHSVDILIIEVLKIVFWFNPFLSIYKKIFNNIHEFQADQKAVEYHDVNQYCSLLARVALMSADFKLANHFNNSLTLKRITMMKTIKKKMSAWKVAVIIPIVAGFFFVVACQDQVMNDATEIAKMSTVALDIPKEVQDRYDERRKANPDKKFLIIETNSEGNAKLDNLKPVMEDLKKNGDKIFASIEVMKPKAKPSELARTFLILEYNNEAREISENSKSADGVFTVVEEPASYIDGGMDGLYRFLNENLKYPEESRKNGQVGRVYVQFVSNTDGSVSDVTVLKSVEAKLDSEAVRLVKLTRWNPGRQNGRAVRSKFVIPLSFGSPQSSKIKEVTSEFKIDLSIAKDGNARIITGTVRGNSGAPLAGTHVIDAGTTNGTETDANGKFAIKVPTAEGQLAVSYVGYRTTTVNYKTD